MATYDNLPVYKSSYDLLLLVFKVVKEFTKEYKYTL
ncbi:four helix bundle protein [bacterium]|nr:four helix bundle protein [bacterium]MBT4633278.1 four helix bundle protein [bacterium]